MNTERQHEQIVAERAAQLLTDVQSGGVRERTALMRWIKQSPLHVREMLVATAWEKLLNALDIDRKYNVDELIDKSRRTVTPISERRDIDFDLAAARAPVESTSIAAANPIDTAPAIEAVAPHTHKSKRWIGYAAAASIFFVMALVGWTGFMSGAAPVVQYQTAIGEQRTVSLEDGSVVFLNTQSQVRVAFSGEARDVYLLGQGIFNVAHDASRPFRVHVEHGQVQAIGTQFDVNCRRDRTDIAVIDGLVRVISDGAGATSQANLPAGKAMAITNSGELTSAEDIDVADVTAWRHRRLVFKGHTLIEIAAEFNRYNKAPQIRVEGEALQSKRYSGTFDADDPQSFLDYLAQDHQLTFERNGDEFVVIRMRSSYAVAAPAK